MRISLTRMEQDALFLALTTYINDIKPINLSIPEGTDIDEFYGRHILSRFFSKKVLDKLTKKMQEEDQ